MCQEILNATLIEALLILSAIQLVAHTYVQGDIHMKIQSEGAVNNLRMTCKTFITAVQVPSEASEEQRKRNREYEQGV